MPKILLVEDNELNRDMLGRRLKRRGYEIVIAIDGNEGVNKARSEMPDLILMDMSLPVLSGWEATQILKSEKQTASIPILALTAHAMVGDREEALAAGCDDYDTKPVDLKRLLHKMEVLLQIAQNQPQPNSSEVVVTVDSTVEVDLPVAPFSDPLPKVVTETASSDLPETSPLVTSPPAQSTLQSSFPQPLISQAMTFTILVVDDNESNRDMLSRRLERRGYDIILAESGEEALQTIAKTNVDLVLLDIMMPGIGGVETLKQMRQTYSQEQLPIIMATAKNTSEDVVQALELGANDYITKPIDLPVALARIQSHLKTREASAMSRQQVLESSVAANPHHTFWDERFRLVEVISKHTFGQTAIAQDLKDPDEPMRIIHTFRLDTNSPEILKAVEELFFAEMAILKQLPPHSQCLPVLSYLQDNEVFHVVHNHIEGTVFSKELKSNSPIYPRMACKFADELLTILYQLQQANFVHGYPHPNCFLQPTKKGQKLVLMDFGVIPRIMSKLSLQYPQYKHLLQEEGDLLAPEVSYGTLKPETDQYVIGKIFLQALQLSDLGTDARLTEHYQTTTQIFAKMSQFNIQARYPTMFDASRAIRNRWHQLWKEELSYKLEQSH